MKIVINVLKILSLVALAAAIPMPLIVAIASFAGIPRLSTILLILAISVLFGAALWLEFSAIANWRAASKANRKGEKVLSKKKSTVLLAVLILYEAAIALLFGLRLGTDGGMLAVLLLAPTLETPYAVALWLGVVVLIKQLLAKTPIS